MLCGARSVANDRLAMLGDHDVDAVTATWELVGQDLATEDSGLARCQARNFASAFSGNTCRHFIGAAGDRILDAERHWNWRRWANRSWLANRGTHWCWFANRFRRAYRLANRFWFAYGLASFLGSTVLLEQTSFSGLRSHNNSNRNHGDQRQTNE